MYLSSTLKKFGYQCDILDLAFYPKNIWSKLLAYTKADLFGLTVYSSSYPESLEIAKLIKSALPNSKIAFGGPHPTFDYLCMNDNPEIDFIVFGEGEGTLLELCQNFGNSFAYREIRGLAYKIQYPDGKRGMFISNMRPPIKDIDNIPMPDREAVPLKMYTRKVDDILSTPVMTARGCAYSCNFCDSHNFWGKLRFHGLSRVLHELLNIYDLGFKAVHFWDDTFTLNSNLDAILLHLKNLGLTFRCNGNLRIDTKETLQKLYDSGCREYAVGIESGDQQVLDIMNKGTTVERNKQVLQWSHEIGLPVKAYIMVGNPGETWDSIEKTLQFVKDTSPAYYTLSNFVPYPGCNFLYESKKFNIKIRTKDWQEYFVIGRANEGGATHDTEFLTAEEIADARKYLLQNLPKQTGKLQDYYKKVKI
jgi:radical SAM superfamily enzyme YgiQ (UPF0313 family)